MHDAKHEDHALLLKEVEHHPMIANSQPEERVSATTQRLHRLAAATGRRPGGACFGETLEGLPHPSSHRNPRLRRST